MIRYCIIDTETSGFSSKVNALCQIAAIVVDSEYNEISRFDRYIKPYGKVYTKQAENVNGLSKTFLHENGSQIEDVIYAFIEFIRENNITHFIGHNIRVFDNKFLTGAFRQFNIRFAHFYNLASFYDTMEMSWKENKIGGSSLKALCLKYDIKYLNNHNAINDCESTLELFKVLKK